VLGGAAIQIGTNTAADCALIDPEVTTKTALVYKRAALFA